MRRSDAPSGCAVRMRRPAADARRVRLPTRGASARWRRCAAEARRPLSRPSGRAHHRVAGGVGSRAASSRGRRRVAGGVGSGPASGRGRRRVEGGFRSGRIRVRRSRGACRTVEVPQIEGCRLTALPARNRFTWVRLPRRAGCESPLAVGGGGDHAAGRSGGMLNGWCGGVALRLGLRHVGAVTVDRRAPGALKGGVRWRPEGLLRGLSAVQPRARCPSWPVAPDQPPVCRDRFWVDTPDG
jgi:hypothetical protein